MNIYQLSGRLDAVEHNIAAICERHGVDPDVISEHYDKFTDKECDELLVLLNDKFELQKTIYEKQGGDLSNVILLSERRPV